MAIRLRDFVRSVLNHKTFVLLCLLTCAGAAVAVGTKKVSKEISEQEQAEINSYYEKLGQYEAALSDYERCLEEQTQKVETLQDYAENSIYMRLDPSAVHCISAQYGISYSEGTDSTKVNQAIVQYLKTGLREEIADADRLGVKYWDEVLSVSFDGGLLVITLMHYDPQLGAEIMGLIMEKLEKKVPEIADAQGAFTISLQEVSNYEKSDVNVANTQNTNINNLSVCNSVKADYENQVAYQMETVDSYRSGQYPDALKRVEMSTADRVKVLVRYGVFGLAFGIALIFMIWLLASIFGNRIFDAKDFEDTDLNVLGVISGDKTKPEMSRILIDIQLLMEEIEKEAGFLYLSENSAASLSAAEVLKTQFAEGGYSVSCGSGKLENTQEAKNLLQAGNAILLVEGGTTTFRQVEEQRKLCARYKASVLGVIVIE